MVDYFWKNTFVILIFKERFLELKRDHFLTHFQAGGALTVEMAASGNLYPNVFMVDTHTDYPPPLPPKPVPFRKRRSVAQPVLFALVILALCGMAVEACFIYSLYTSKSSPGDSETQEMSKQVADKPTPIDNPVVPPSKPLAHMNSNQKPTADGLMLWHDYGESIIHGMKYKDGGLIIQEEGYYFVYSKVYFTEKHNISLLHSIVRTTDRYPEELVLLQSREYIPKSIKNFKTNSYLGGMFHFFKGDTIFVRVNNTEIILSTSADNYFGAYMV
ncbi:tumor necrosis factor ligand superfamily member 6-like [Alosa sapidissima]|uniref:tumor necrosis factor ligand superfamily member 6-like n=1 Tax=Alosa sapidissima TaxID=34773 RepID=UPI001C083D65|nr:tumor necrosis factor ligand superfamily member 6-like [Alosa sapidissima]